jgi:hypothetical protein
MMAIAKGPRSRRGRPARRSSIPGSRRFKNGTIGSTTGATYLPPSQQLRMIELVRAKRAESSTERIRRSFLAGLGENGSARALQGT